MQRIPEPDLMNDIAQAKAYAATDFSEPHNAFVEHFRQCFPDFNSGSVLDLGCGTADITIRFAKALPDIRIDGIDGAKAMLDIGRNDVVSANLTGRIFLHDVCLPNKHLGSNMYDAIISNSLLHHLNDPSVLWETVKICTKKDCPIFIMDLLRPDSTEKAEHLVNLHAGSAPDLLKKDFYNSLLASYNIEEIHHQLRTASLEHLDVMIVSDRHVIIWGAG